MIVTAKELSKMYGIHRSTLWEWEKKGMPVIREHPHYIKYDTKAVEKWVKDNKNFEPPKQK